MTNFLSTLRALDAAAKSGSWAIAYGSSKMTPVEAQQALQRFLGGHAAAIAGVVEALQTISNGTTDDPRNLAHDALAALEGK